MGSSGACAGGDGVDVDVDDGRHFPNDYDDGVEPSLEEVRRSIPGTLIEVLDGQHRSPSVYSGGGGPAFALLSLAKRGLHPRPDEAAAEALRRLQAGETRFDSRRVTLLEGAPGSVALQAWAHLQLGARDEALACASRLATMADGVRSLAPGECEVLYGRCGFLGAILFMRRLLGDRNLLAEQASGLVRQVVQAGKREATRGWPLYYEWHQKCYLGGAHGIAGILLTLLQLPSELDSAGDDSAALVRETASALLSSRFRSGNMPSSRGNGRDRCVHWCHGAPGVIPLLIKLAEAYEDPEYMTIACEMGEVVWKRGLLSTKGLGLCHGIPGNGYALLALHRATRDAQWLRRAQHFAVVAAEKAPELVDLADRPHSLFEGLAGALCFWADVIHASERRDSSDIAFPCYEF